MSSSRSWRLLRCVLLLAVPPVRAAAQDRIFPNVQSFELPEASPRVHGLVGRIFSARRGDSQFGREPEAEVGVGENFPVIALRRGERPVTLGFGTQVYGRFSLGDRKSALISNDWVVGLNTTAALGAWTLTGELYHESSHLGDEYSDRFSATRLDWTREVVGAWLTYGPGPIRITGNLSYVLIDELGLDRPGAALAADYEGRTLGHFLGGPMRLVGGIFFQGEAATNWRISTSAKLGIALSGSDGRREIGLALIAHDGLSTQRQFFRRESRYIGGELRFDL
jgi:uncharacterized protein DUF1207